MSIEQEIIKAYPEQLPGIIFMEDDIEKIREWYKTHSYVWPYYELKEKIVSKGLEYRCSIPVRSKYKIEQKEEWTLENDEELEMFHFRLYDDYGKLFGVILLCAEEISEAQQKKIDIAKEAGIRVGGEELINELEIHNIREC